MSEKSTSTKRPLSAAIIGKATGVFTRPKLQRRAFTAYSPSELLSAVRLSNVVLDLKANNHEDEKPAEFTGENTSDIATLSPCLTTCDGGRTFNLVNSLANDEQKQERVRRNSDTIVSSEKQLGKHTVTNSQPKNDLSIHCLQVKEIIKDTLKAQLCHMDYSHRECGEKGRIISQSIEKSIKELNTKLYKVMVLVYVGAIRDQGIELACQCLWSPEVDFFAMDTYKNETLFASGVVFATLYE